jgi:hypothetical protein
VNLPKNQEDASRMTVTPLGGVVVMGATVMVVEKIVVAGTDVVVDRFDLTI